MDTYITGATIKTLREKKGITQAELADILGVSSKTVSKWETAKGLPDISLIEPLAKALSVSVMELLSGNTVINKNTSSNVLRSKFYVCPICGNIIRTMGDAFISCCGITLPPLEAEELDNNHQIIIEKVEDEHFITINHDMTKEHYISFLAYLTCDRVQFVKFYPEGNAETRLNFRGRGYLYIYCNKHGLMKMKI
ncbi:MAG: helix-turn-helix domain-containing protein [Ruminococcus sp.]|nr:helix-turn-helix domain-containing protein [Ruminococcus sp.]